MLDILLYTRLYIPLFVINFICSSCGQLIYTLRDYKRPVLSAVLRGSMLASGTSNGGIFLYDIVSGEQLKVVQGHGGAVTALAAEALEG